MIIIKPLRPWTIPDSSGGFFRHFVIPQSATTVLRILLRNKLEDTKSSILHKKSDRFDGSVVANAVRKPHKIQNSSELQTEVFSSKSLPVTMSYTGNDTSDLTCPAAFFALGQHRLRNELFTMLPTTTTSIQSSHLSFPSSRNSMDSIDITLSIINDALAVIEDPERKKKAK